MGATAARAITLHTRLTQLGFEPQGHSPVEENGSGNLKLRMRHDSLMFAKFGITDENEPRIKCIEAGNRLNKSKSETISVDALSWCDILFASDLEAKTCQDFEAKARQARSKDASKSDRREDGTAEDTSSKRAKSTKGSSNSDRTHASHSSKGSSGKKEDETKRGKEAERGANTVHATMTIHGTPAQVMDFNNAVRDMRSSKASTDDKGPKIIASHLLSQKLQVLSRPASLHSSVTVRGGTVQTG